MTLNPSSQAYKAMALTLGFDIAMAMLAMFAAAGLQTGFSQGTQLQSAAIAGAIFGLCALAAFLLVGVHRQVWRHMGMNDAVRILQAVGLASLLALPAFMIWPRLVDLSVPTFLLALVLWVLALLGGRMVALNRSTRRPFQLFTRDQADGQPAVLMGDGASVAAVLRDLHNARKGARVRILGLLLTDGAEPGRAIRGVTVMGGPEDLEFVLGLLDVRYGKVPWVAVTGRARRPALMNRTLETAARMQSKVMALSAGKDTLELKKLRPTDLLARPQRHLDTRPVSELISGARVLVTGGGGTIGLELAKQCARLGPADLTILDLSEYNTYRAGVLLQRTAPDLKLRTIIGDVRDTERVNQVFGEIRPDIVIHAAALKHVPLMEQNACEAILTNIAGAINVTRASVKHGARRFVFISTDKAVDPDNVMGATKRVAEIAVGRIGQVGGLSPALVRFGNVLGSSGSVVPLFTEQIESGGPVTVTHPDVTRYFMTVEEAGALVLQAAALQDDGRAPALYVLDMGEPIHIEALAEAMILMRGLVPERDIRIVHTGLRPGEKLHETLTHEFENLSPTPIKGILQVEGATGVDDGFDLLVASLLRAAARRDRNEAVLLLGKLIPQYAATQTVPDHQLAGA